MPGARPSFPLGPCEKLVEEPLRPWELRLCSFRASSTVTVEGKRRAVCGVHLRMFERGILHRYDFEKVGRPSPPI